MPRILRRTATLLIATHNAGKAREVAELMTPFVGRLELAAEHGLAEVPEDAPTFEGNAALKARAAAAESGWAALADDSGLVVPALDGDPGVFSARWAGEPRDFFVAMTRVHRELLDRASGDMGAPLPSRQGWTLQGGAARASMVCALALAWPDGRVENFEGRVEGALVWPPRGDLGFGYEPMFQPLGATRTYGEMARADKHADDPRARAFRLLRAACLEGDPAQ